MSHKTTFNNRAQSYAAGRPGYAEGCLKQIFSLLPPGGTVADMGAGTGIFTKEVLMRGYPTYAIEPNGDMGSVLQANFGGAAGLTILPTTAEATGLPAGSIDLVAAASSFHWLDSAAFRKECLRILKPGGVVCIFINARDYDNAFTRAQHALCLQYCNGFTSLCHGLQKISAAMPAFFGGAYQQGKYDFPLQYTKEKFVHRCLSSSYAPEPDTPAYHGYIAALQRLLEETTAEDTITVPNATVMFWGTPR